MVENPDAVKQLLKHKLKYEKPRLTKKQMRFFSKADADLLIKRDRLLASRNNRKRQARELTARLSHQPNLNWWHILLFCISVILVSLWVVALVYLYMVSP